MILVVGHKNPDSDSICGALVAAELLKARGLEAKAVRQGEINRETQHILEPLAWISRNSVTALQAKKYGWLTIPTLLKHRMTSMTLKS